MGAGEVTVDIPLTPVNSNGLVMTRQLDSAQSGDYLHKPALREQTNEKDSRWRRQGGRRRIKEKVESNGSRGHGGEEEILTKMGQFYSKILDFSIVTRYFLYVLPIALFFTLFIILGATVAKDCKIGTVPIVWFFTWIEIVWLSLWISKLFAKLLPFIFQFLCGIVSSGTRKYALVLKALEIPLSLAGWALASLATFKPIMTHRSPPVHWESIVNSILAALLVASLIFLAEKLLIQLISINYHRKQFNGRIKESKHNIYLLSLLYEASRTLFPAYCPEFAEEDYLINDSISLGSSTKTSHNRSGSGTPLAFIRGAGRVGDKLTSAFGNIAQEITGKEVFNPTSAHSVVVEALEKTKSSEALAKRLWMSFVVEGKESLYHEDIIEVLGTQRTNEADECFASLDRDGNGDVSLDEMILTVVEFGRERHSIASSMADVDQAIHVLDQLLGTIVFVMIVFVFVGFLNASFTTTLATAGTALLSLSFVFSATAAEVLGSCIFLFVKHPFDVGDRVDIQDINLVVEHISLLYSVFKRVDTHKTVQIPNIVLNTVWIENVSRSKAMRERISMFVSFDTSLEDIGALRSEIQAFVNDKDNSRDFQPDVDVEIVGIAEMNKLELRVEIRHKSNWANETLRAARRSKFMCALVIALRKVPIYAPGGGDAALGDINKPSYSVAVSTAEAQAARKKFLDDKESKRLYPSALKPVLDIQEVMGKANLSADAFPKPPKVTGTDYTSAKTSNVQSRRPERPQESEELRPPTASTSGRTAVEGMNPRNPVIDYTRDDWETYRDGMAVPSNRDDSEFRRSNDLEEVRGMLRRQSTRGRRKAGATGASPPLAQGRIPPQQPQQAQIPRKESVSKLGGGYVPYAPSRSDGRAPPYSSAGPGPTAGFSGPGPANAEPARKPLPQTKGNGPLNAVPVMQPLRERADSFSPHPGSEVYVPSQGPRNG